MLKQRREETDAIMKCKGITIAGNIIVDVVKEIDRYPDIGMLVNIRDVAKAVGGCVPNTSINLAKIDGNIPINVLGRVGDDENGRYVLGKMRENGIETKDVVISGTKMTSFDDVMSLRGGERTFFCMQGANSEFCPSDIDIDMLDCEIFHIGYILLLDEFDASDAEYGTVMAGFLAQLQNKGIKTSIDVVTSAGGDYASKITPALRYCSYAIMNEIECSSIWNVDVYMPDGTLNVYRIRDCMERMASVGVKDKVIIHCKEAAFVLDVKTGNFESVASLNIPGSVIKGSVGAGDAFCAGCLYGLYNGYSDRKLIEFASAAAACSLFEANAVDGMKSRDDLALLENKYGRRKLLNIAD